VPRTVLLRSFLRSLLLQASWNRRGMQNLGFAYAIWPALEWLYPLEDDRVRAVQRHLTFFNTHPYLAPAILGGAILHEQRISRGEESPESVERFKQALMYPLAAVGDSFFWLSLRPFAGAVSVAALPWLGLAVVPMFLLVYSLPHLVLRARLFVLGYRLGDSVVERVARLGLPRWAGALRWAVGFLGGSLVAVAGLLAAATMGPAAPRGLGIAAGVLVFLAAYAILRSRGPVLAGWLALAVGTGISLLSGG
jgi:PTS system mannose-specific IID component